VGAVGSDDGATDGTGVVGAGEAYWERRVGCGTEPSELEGCDVLKYVLRVGAAVGLR